MRHHSDPRGKKIYNNFIENQSKCIDVRLVGHVKNISMGLEVTQHLNHHRTFTADPNRSAPSKQFIRPRRRCPNGPPTRPPIDRPLPVGVLKLRRLVQIEDPPIP